MRNVQCLGREPINIFSHHFKFNQQIAAAAQNGYILEYGQILKKCTV